MAEVVADEVVVRRPVARLAGFDGLRGLAAVGVLVLHSTDLALGRHWRVQDVVAQLQSGVQVFFVLSAFLLSRPFVRAVLARRPLPGVRAYARNRVLRIIPAYWLALVGCTVLLGSTSMRGVKDWLYQLSLTQIYSVGEFSRGISVAWTLSVEVTFYLLLPFFFAGVAWLGRRVSPLVSLACGTAALFAVGVPYMVWAANSHRFLPSFWLPFFLPVFASGIALAIVREAVTEPHRQQAMSRFARRSAVVWWAAAAAVLLFAAFRYGHSVLIPYRAHLLGSQTAYAVYAFLLVAPLALDVEGRSVVTRTLQRRVVVYLGVVSYPLYLWHNEIAGYVRDHWLHRGRVPANAFEQLAIVFAVTLIVASVSWYALERPVIAWGRRLHASRRPAFAGHGASGEPAAPTEPAGDADHADRAGAATPGL